MIHEYADNKNGVRREREQGKQRQRAPQAAQEMLPLVTAEAWLVIR